MKRNIFKPIIAGAFTFGYLLSQPITLFAEADEIQPRYFVKTVPTEGGDNKRVFAEIGAQTYEISTAQWDNENPLKWVVSTSDLDRDGWLDAIIALSSGGNCCAPSYLVVSYRGDGFFVASSHPDFWSWQDPELIDTPSGSVIRVVAVPAGVGNTSMEEWRYDFRLVNGRLQLVSKLQNSAMIHAKVSMTSEAVIKRGKEQGIIKADIDGDGKPDTMTCQYWERWGALGACEVATARFGKIQLGLGCQRWGILETETNGLRDLVCNRDIVLKFDGSQYVEAQ